MKVAVLGDIHSNHFALEACLARIDALGIRHLLFLGDYVSDCACPARTLALLREVQTACSTQFIRGNRENYMLSHHTAPRPEWVRGSRYGSLLYTYEQLTEADFAWFASMPIAGEAAYRSAPVLGLCHGSPARDRCMLLPDSAEMSEVLQTMEHRLLLCAHTHRSFIYRQGGCTVINGGTVGLPEEGDSDAQFALLEYRGGEWRPALMRVPYDVEGAVREIRGSALYASAEVWARAVIKTLRTGKSWTIPCLQLANQISAEEKPADEEICWRRAAERLGL